MLNKSSFLILFFIIFTYSQLRADWIVTSKSGDRIRLAFPKENLDEEKGVFIRSFTSAYKDNQTIINDIKNILKIDLSTSLDTSFKKEENDFISNKSDVVFITAKNEEGQTLGFVSFDREKNGIYIRRLAIDPEFSGKGLGKLLVFSILNIWDKSTKIQLVTRRANTNALNFYKKIGFDLSNFEHPGVDPKIYCGLELSLSSIDIKTILNNYQQIENSILSYKILTLPVTSPELKNILITENNEELIDLKMVNNKRIIPLEYFNKAYNAGHNENGKVRLGVYYKLLDLLQYLPHNIGITFFEGYRPLWKQREYFDKVFMELLQQFNDGDIEKAYTETCKLVSPFIDNIPVHCTGAAIDFSLFEFNDQGDKKLLDLGKFGVIFGKNDQSSTLTENVTIAQSKNRKMLLEAASKVGLVNYGYEWWHYSYGDRSWAYFEKKEKAQYGLINNDYIPINKTEYLKMFDIIKDRVLSVEIDAEKEI